MKRIDMIPKRCCRCGNDLLNGQALIHLPYEKRYISFCGVCSEGLGIKHLFQFKEVEGERLKTFFEEEYEQ